MLSGPWDINGNKNNKKNGSFLMNFNNNCSIGLIYKILYRGNGSEVNDLNDPNVLGYSQSG